MWYKGSRAIYHPSILKLIGTIRTFQSLNNNIFTRLWITNWLLYIARSIELVTLSWLVLELTDSPSKVALVGVCRMLPMFFLGIVAGHFADKINKIKLLASVQILNILVGLFVILLLASDDFHVSYAYLAILITGMGWTLDFAARRAYYSELFPSQILVNAVSLDTVSMTGSMMIGAALGGSLIYLIGFSGTYGLLILLYSLGLFLLLFLPSKSKTIQAYASEKTVFTQVKETVSGLISNKILLNVFLVTLALNLFGFPYMQLVPVIARDVLGGDEILFGFLLSSSALGAMTGSLIIASKKIIRLGLLYLGGALLMLFALFVFSFSNIYLVSAALLFVVGLGSSAFATMQVAIALSTVNSEQRGRAMGSVALGIGASPLGMLGTGYLADIIGAQYSLALCSGTGILIMLLLTLFLPTMRNYSSN